MTGGGHAVGARIGYAHASARVHRWVEQQLGGSVSTVIDCVGGMSPGPAARVRTKRGASAFVKACGIGLNANTPDLLRSEARVLAALPPHPCLPRLLDVYDDGDWVALLVEDLVGASAPAPWRRDDLRRVSDAIREVRPVLDATALDGLPAAKDSSPIFLTRWRDLEARLDLLDPWWATHHVRWPATPSARPTSSAVMRWCTGICEPTTSCSPPTGSSSWTGDRHAAGRGGWTTPCLPWTAR